MGRGQQSGGNARRRMQREKTREALKKGQTGVEADKAEEESATTVISGFVTVVFVWLVVVCGGTWLSGYGGSVIGAASPTGSVRKMPPVRSPGAGAGAAVDVAPPSSSSAARTNDSGGDEGAVEQEADDSGPSTFTASELMQREFSLESDLDALVKCKYTTKKNCGTEVDALGPSTVQVTTKKNAMVNNLHAGVVYSLPEASNDFTITLMHGDGPKPFYSTYANLDLTKKYKIGQEIGSKAKLGQVKENTFELTLSVEGGGAVSLA
mmetsp:Transcript_12926/g.25663  ORF Transcript_12926/g.25663 Transcript_12926/m.25663 type:complete len:266 (-) Transcript_12926:52-849(-)